MATATLEKPQAPTQTALTPFQDFQQQLSEREAEIVSMLPSDVNRARFTNSTLAAIKQNPDLLKCSPRSLFTAITKSAQDGLLPDGREGVITKYGSDAQWNAMTYGIRKRARELDGIIIDAQVVYENDHFVWHQGDEPSIEHEPARLGTERGAMIGTYAIFKREGGAILHREVMDRPQVEMVRNQSKAKDSLMWTKFETEGWRKTVIRRGMKTVPVSENLERVITRDDEHFNFDQRPEPTLTPPPAPLPTPQAKAKVLADVTGRKASEDSPLAEYFDMQKVELTSAKTAHEKQVVTDAVYDSIAGFRERGEISESQAEILRAEWDEIAA